MTNLWLKSSLIAVVCTMACTSFGACEKSSGLVNCQQSELQELHEVGSVLLKHSQVHGTTHIVGSLQAEGTKFGKIALTGNAELIDCKVSKSSHITGGVKLDKSKIAATLKINSNHAVISGSTLKKIRMHYRGADQPRIEVKNGSLVSGDIDFIGSYGLVLVDKQSKVTGSVTNGEIVRN